MPLTRAQRHGTFVTLRLVTHDPSNGVPSNQPWKRAGHVTSKPSPQEIVYNVFTALFQECVNFAANAAVGPWQDDLSEESTTPPTPPSYLARLLFHGRRINAKRFEGLWGFSCLALFGQALNPPVFWWAWVSGNRGPETMLIARRAPSDG